MESGTPEPSEPPAPRVLLDQAVLAEGSRLKDPAGFARRMNELLVRSASDGEPVSG